MKATKAYLPCVNIPSYDPVTLPLNFVLSDCPSVARIPEYASSYAGSNVVGVVRICDSALYEASTLLEELWKSSCNNGSSSADNMPSLTHNVEKSVYSLGPLRFLDSVHFEDGGVPSNDLIAVWLDFLESIMTSDDILHFAEDKHKGTPPTLAVHCVSGLGRAPILVCIAIMEYNPHVDALDVVQWIRGYRRGALNSVQISWLENDYQKNLRRKGWKKRRLAYRQHATPEPDGSKVSLSSRSLFKRMFKRKK